MIFQRAHLAYRGFTVWYELPPIPGGDRIAWHFEHEDDAGEDIGRRGAGPSFEDCCTQIDELLAEDAYEAARYQREMDGEAEEGR